MNNNLEKELYYKLIDIDNSFMKIIEDFESLNKSIDENFRINGSGIYNEKLEKELKNIKNIEEQCKKTYENIR